MPRKTMVTLTESMFYVLMALRYGKMCGTDAAEYIKHRTCGELKIGPATLYTILGKFEKEKYITQVSQKGRKRTYAITARGAAAYDAEVARLRRCLEDAQREDKNDGQTED